MFLSMTSCWDLHISTVQKQSTIRAISHLTSLQEASDFVHVNVLVGHAITAVLTEFSSSPKLTCQSNSSRKGL